MKIFKSHFWYSKSQRNGILFLLIAIVVFQLLRIWFTLSYDSEIEITSKEIAVFQKHIDSLKRLKKTQQKSIIHSFNPNFISDYKGYVLGMSVAEIDRLHAFRKAGKWINSVKEFKNVTKVSDSLLSTISKYFKFPDWVRQNKNINIRSVSKKMSTDKEKASTNDINKATEKDFQTIKGIGKKLSQRIVKYRTKLQGFSFESQLNEVWGLDEEVVINVLRSFKIVHLPTIQKVNVNTATFKQVLKNPYIDYKLCKKIFEYRDEVAELQDIAELKNIDDFPLEKYERIILYLVAN